MNRRLVVVVLMTVAAIVLVQVAAQAQCAMCRTALENSPEGKGMAAAFNNGIVFLLVIPYALFSTIGVVIYRAHRKKKRDAEEAEARAANPYLRGDSSLLK